jgi:hypothetical protein
VCYEWYKFQVQVFWVVTPCSVRIPTFHLPCKLHTVTRFEREYVMLESEVYSLRQFSLWLHSSWASILIKASICHCCSILPCCILNSGRTCKHETVRMTLWTLFCYKEGRKILHGWTFCTIQVKAFGVATLCSVVVWYQHFSGPCCFHHQGEVALQQAGF